VFKALNVTHKEEDDLMVLEIMARGGSDLTPKQFTAVNFGI
jgi:hypothetical protein